MTAPNPTRTPTRANRCRPPQREVVEDRIATQFVGDADEVAHRLDALQRVTAADELVITTATHQHDDRLRSHELIAKRWGL